MQNIVSAISNSIVLEKAAIHELAAILKQEQTVLLKSSHDDLVKLAETKSQCILRIAELSQVRYGLVKNAGFSANEVGMRLFIETSTEESLKNIWRELIEDIQAVKEVNRVNGLLITKMMAKNSQALQILNNQHRNSGVYGPDGQTTRNKSRGISV